MGTIRGHSKHYVGVPRSKRHSISIQMTSHSATIHLSNATKNYKPVDIISLFNICIEKVPYHHHNLWESAGELHKAINSRLNTVSQPSKGSNTSQYTVSSHFCLASSAVGGGGAVRDGRASFGIVVLSAACTCACSFGCVRCVCVHVYLCGRVVRRRFKKLERDGRSRYS